MRNWEVFILVINVVKLIQIKNKTKNMKPLILSADFKFIVTDPADVDAWIKQQCDSNNWTVVNMIKKELKNKAQGNYELTISFV